MSSASASTAAVVPRYSDASDSSAALRVSGSRTASKASNASRAAASSATSGSASLAGVVSDGASICRESCSGSA